MDCEGAELRRLDRPITRGAIGPLLDAARVARGTRCSISPAARLRRRPRRRAGRRGARRRFAPSMVAEARRAYPGAARRRRRRPLPYADAFDAAICGFGLLHMADPDGRSPRRTGSWRRAGATPSRCGRGQTGTTSSRWCSARSRAWPMDVDLPPAPPICFSDQAVRRAAAGRRDRRRDPPAAWQEPGSARDDRPGDGAHGYADGAPVRDGEGRIEQAIRDGAARWADTGVRWRSRQYWPRGERSERRR